jgi:hypothetical protein
MEPGGRAVDHMRYGYKIIPLILLTFYIFCGLCPDRILAAGITLRTAAAGQSHDCDKRSEQQPAYECRLFFSHALPSPIIKILHDLSAGIFLNPPNDWPFASGHVALLRATDHLPAGPPPTLQTKLRI